MQRTAGCSGRANILPIGNGWAAEVIDIALLDSLKCGLRVPGKNQHSLEIRYLPLYGTGGVLRARVFLNYKVGVRSSKAKRVYADDDWPLTQRQWRNVSDDAELPVIKINLWIWVHEMEIAVDQEKVKRLSTARRRGGSGEPPDIKQRINQAGLAYVRAAEKSYLRN